MLKSQKYQGFFKMLVIHAKMNKNVLTFALFTRWRMKKCAQQCLPWFLWRGRHLGTCESLGSSLVKMSKAFHTVRVPQPFDLRRFYFYRKVNTLKLWKCGLYFGSDVLQLLLRDLFIILSWFLAGFCSVLKNVPGIQRPFDQLPSRIRKVNTFKTR